MNLSLPLFDFADALQADAPEAPGPALHDPQVPAPVSAGAAPPAALADPNQPPGMAAALHPAVWRASQLGGGAISTRPSGFAALDAQLPGGGWPHGVLTELLLAQPGIGELRLLAPALMPLGSGVATASTTTTGRCVMLFDPPASLSAWALAQCGLDSRHWLVVRSRPSSHGRRAGGGAPAGGQAGGAAPADRQAGGGASATPLAWRPDTAPGVPRGASRLAPLLPGADLLWALEQALKSGQVGAVLAWLPVNLRADALRRLQLAAQAQDGPVFIFRDALARGRPSPAPLRLLLQPAGLDGLSVRLLKRRGPLLAQPLRLLLPAVLPVHLPDLADAQPAGDAHAGAAGGGPPSY